MTFLDLHPLDPYEARFKMVATLVLLSQLGVAGPDRVPPAKSARAKRAKPLPGGPSPRRGTLLVRPPRSC